MTERPRFAAWESETEYYLKIPFDQKERAKAIPNYRWNPEEKCWVYPRTAKHYDSITAEFGEELVSIQITRPAPPVAGDPTIALREENRALKDKIHHLERELEEKKQLLKVISEERQKSNNSIISENETLKIALQELKNQLVECQDRYKDALEKLKQSEYELHISTQYNNNVQEIKEIVKNASGNNNFNKFVEKLRIDNNAPIEIAKYLENRLRDYLSLNDKNVGLYDLISMARDAEIMSEEAVNLAHLIRRQRNILAHEKVDIKTHKARILLILLSAALLWPQLPE